MPTETKTGPVNLQPGEFDTLVLKAATPVLVDFWAPWCGPCRMVAPILDELAGTYAGRLAIVKVNVDNHPDLAAQYEIRSIPSLLVFKNGQVVETIVGAVPRRALEQKLAPFTA